MYIYALKEIVRKYRRHNTTVFMCFLDGSKDFDWIIHGKLFAELQEPDGVRAYLHPSCWPTGSDPVECCHLFSSVCIWMIFLKS